MLIMLSVLIAISVISCVMGIVYSVNAERLMVQDRLQKYVVKQSDQYLLPELILPLRQRISQVLVPVIYMLVNKLVPANQKQSYEKKLQAAGYPCGLDVSKFISVKYGLLIAALLLGIISRSPLNLLAYLVLGYIAPDFWLKANEDKRKDQIMKALPDVLDLISVSVEAGLSFDGSLQKVIEKSEGPLTNEFEKSLKEIEMGKPRREALKDMAERVAVDDVSVFIGSILQADQLGISLTNVLRLQAGQVRENRRMRAEEKAQKAPVKILLPLVLFIFPTILIVLLGPAAIRMMSTF